METPVPEGSGGFWFKQTVARKLRTIYGDPDRTWTQAWSQIPAHIHGYGARKDKDGLFLGDGPGGDDDDQCFRPTA